MRVWCFHLKDSHKIPIQFLKKGEYYIFRVTLMIPVSETWGYTLTQKPELRDKRDFMIYTHRLNFSMKFSYFLKMQIFYPDITHYRLSINCEEP